MKAEEKYNAQMITTQESYFEDPPADLMLM